MLMINFLFVLLNIVYDCEAACSIYDTLVEIEEWPINTIDFNAIYPSGIALARAQ